MKPSLLTLSLLLFAFAFAFSTDVSVFDYDENPVMPGVRYYIRVPPDHFGGAYLRKTGNSSCQVTVVQHVYSYGYVTFSMPSGENNSAIVANHPVDIEFTEKPNCTESSKWIVYFDNEVQRYCVAIGGPEDHPGQQILNGTFRIRIFRDHNFVFCLDQPVEGSPSCFVIGTYYPGHGVQSRLILLENQHKHHLLTFAIFPADDSHRAIRTVV